MEAFFYNRKENKKVECLLCPHNCVIADGKRGMCHVRRNHEGMLQAETYGKISAIHFDPIEKKPLYHFFPSREILSIGSVGCNMFCSFCQNCEISQTDLDSFPSLKEYKTSEILEIATGRPENIGIAYTYNEPIVFYEYMLELARQVKMVNLHNVMVSNGFVSPEPLDALLPYIDAFNIDLKGFSTSFYKKLTGSQLHPVLDTLKRISKSGRLLEITNLLITNENDDRSTFAEMIDWIKTELGENTVLHISRYFPNYKLNNSRTPEQLMLEYYDLAKEKLNFVYLGNLQHAKGQDTICPQCSNLLISRSGYYTEMRGLDKKGICVKCGLGVLKNV